VVPIVVAIGIGAAVGYALGLPAPRLWNGDSGGYVSWSPFRTPGYPAFLSGVTLLSPSLGALRFIQSACLVLATAFFCLGMAQLGCRRWLVVVLGCAVLLPPPFWERAGEIRPEIIFVCLIEVLFAASAFALATGGRRWGAMAGMALGLAILVRPVGYALAPGLLLVAAAVARRQGARAAIVMVVPAAALLIGTSLANGVLRAYFGTQAFGGVLLLGKVAPLIPPDGFGDPTSARLGAALGDLHGLAERSDGETLFWISQQTYTPVLWDRLVPVLAAEGGDATVAANRIATQVAHQAVVREPGLYARLVRVHFESMWTWPWITTSVRIAPVREQMRSPPLAALLGDATHLHDFVEMLVPEWVYRIKLAALAGAFVVCCLVPLAALANGLADPLLVLAAAAAVSLQAYDLVIAAIDVTVSRFALPAVPMLGVALAGIPAMLRALGVLRVPAR
jgi:hypothetical protein